MSPSWPVSRTNWAAIRRAGGSLRARLAFLVLLTVLPLACLLVLMTLEQRQRALATAKAEVLQLAELATTEHEALIESGRQLLAGLSTLPQVRRRDPAELNGLLAALLEVLPQCDNLSLIATDGNLIASAVPTIGPLNLSHRTHFQRAMATGQFAVGDYQVSVQTGTAVVVMAFPVAGEGGRIESVITAALSLERMGRFAYDSVLPSSSSLTLVDRSGTVMAHIPDTGGWVGRSLVGHPLAPVLMRNEGGVSEVEGLDGEMEVMGVASPHSLGQPVAYVAVGRPRALVYQPANRSLFWHLVVVSIVALVSLLGARLLGEPMLLRGIGTLLRGTRELSAGNMDARVGELDGELGELARAFNTMAETLGARGIERERLLAQLETVIEATPVGLGLYDLDGRIIRMNQAGREITGFSRQDEARSLEDRVDLYRVEDARGRPAAAENAPLARALRGEEVRGEVTAFIRDGRKRWLLVSGATVRVGDGRSLGAVVAFADIAELRHAEDEIRRGRERLRALSEQLLDVQEAERRHLARELHDEIGQQATGLKLTLEMCRPIANEEARRYLDDAVEIADELVAEVRSLSLQLRPAMLDDLGLVPAVAWFLGRYTSTTRVEVDFKHAGLEGRRFDPRVETTAYRLIQEGLTNVARHSGASRASVRVVASRESLDVEIEDDGRGFDVAPILTERATGGLFGMMERVSLLGGTFDILSSPGSGTTVSAMLPVRPVDEEGRNDRDHGSAGR